MTRQLYRCYLYAVCIVLLIIATITTAISLQLLLENTPLRGAYDTLPTHNQVIQAEVAFLTAWLVAGLLGGLHYWLIRRDLASDPAAGGGAVRSYFLNITQLFAALIAAGFAANGITALGLRYNSTTTTFSATLAVGGLFALLQWERMRTRAQTKTNAARAFERLHLYGAQLVLIFIATPLWLQAAQTSVLRAFAHLRLYDACVYYGYANTNIACTPESVYPLRQIAGQWGGALFIAACWAGYTVFSRNDRHSRLRQVTHLLAMAYALAFVISAVQRLFAMLMLQVIGRPVEARTFTPDVAAALGTLVFGTVVIAAYSWLYAREAPGLPSGVPTAGLIQMGLVAVVFAFPFWLGAQSLLSQIVEPIVPMGMPLNAINMSQAGAQVLAGLPFVVFALLLGMRTQRTGITWPHRVFVLILLAASVIMSATGMVIGLQALGSTLLGAPPDGWQHTARVGLVTLLVGVMMAAAFLTVAMRNHYLGGRADAVPAALEPPPPAASPVVVGGPGAYSEILETPGTLEAILDALLAGRMSRDEAAASIRAREIAR